MTPVIEVSDFERVDVRVGRILSAEKLPGARKPSYRIEVDLGPLGRRCSVAALAVDYRLEQLAGRQVVCVVNFPPRRVAGVKSEVLILAAIEDSGGLRLLSPQPEAELGSRVA